MLHIFAANRTAQRFPLVSLSNDYIVIDFKTKNKNVLSSIDEKIEVPSQEQVLDRFIIVYHCV